MKKLTTKQFIEKANKIHNYKYDYSLSTYLDNRQKIKIICFEHGEFEQQAGSHLAGKGCIKCKGLNKSTTEEFINKAKEIHGDKYDYSKVIYKNNFTKVKIICCKHGEFEQIPHNHLNGSICLKCSYEENTKNLTKTKEFFINQATKIHGDKYDYSFVNYIKSIKPVEIVCKIHGMFKQTPSTHVRGSGCIKCNKISYKHKVAIDNLELLKERIGILHKDKYKYDFSNYQNQHSKILITCPDHGNFLQKMHSHLRGTGCKFCSDISNYKKSNWIKKANGKQGMLYILRCWNEDEKFYKVGITFNNIKKRYRSLKCMPYNYRVIKEIKSEDLGYIWDLEKKIKKFKRNKHYTPLIKFAGSVTECFK